uniref:Uncharacterized protein n=1 Tax=Cucumis melo TaxID=3656 RepID=A0A9I9CFG5_CUCME
MGTASSSERGRLPARMGMAHDSEEGRDSRLTFLIGSQLGERQIFDLAERGAAHSLTEEDAVQCSWLGQKVVWLTARTKGVRLSTHVLFLVAQSFRPIYK